MTSGSPIPSAQKRAVDLRPLAAVLLLLSALPNLTAQTPSGFDPNPPSTPPGPSPPVGAFTRGRSTYYGGPDTLHETYDSSRGEGSFGILTYGSCGYTPSDGSLPFPRDEVAAAADQNLDWPGSCDRCYEVKCVSGYVLANTTRNVSIVNGLFDDDKFRPYLAAINPGFKDSHGRSYPGNVGEDAGLQDVQCWDDKQVIFVRIIDSCPCKQVLKAGAPGTPADEIRRQEWCCGSQNHFDLSYWAFEKLAHPVYGVITIDYRPVDCDTRNPRPLTPGYVSPYLYKDGIQTGWSWFPQQASNSEIKRNGYAPDGSAATCMKVATTGGITFKCRDCYRSGYQPFANATSIDFWIRPDSGSNSPYDSSTPLGQIPPLKIFLMGDELSKYCINEVYLNSSSNPPWETKGDWYHFSIPMADFDCASYPGQDHLDRLDFQNMNALDAQYCLAALSITSGAQPVNASKPARQATTSPPPTPTSKTSRPTPQPRPLQQPPSAQSPSKAPSPSPSTPSPTSVQPPSKPAMPKPQPAFEPDREQPGSQSSQPSPADSSSWSSDASSTGGKEAPGAAPSSEISSSPFPIFNNLFPPFPKLSSPSWADQLWPNRFQIFSNPAGRRRRNA